MMINGRTDGPREREKKWKRNLLWGCNTKQDEPFIMIILVLLLLINDVLSLKKGYPKADLTFRASIQQNQTSTYTLHTHGAHSLIEFRKKKKKTNGNVMMMVTAAAVYSNGQLLSTLLMNRNRVFLSLSLYVLFMYLLFFSYNALLFQLIHFFFLNARARSFVGTGRLVRSFNWLFSF